MIKILIIFYLLGAIYSIGRFIANEIKWIFIQHNVWGYEAIELIIDICGISIMSVIIFFGWPIYLYMRWKNY